MRVRAHSFGPGAACQTRGERCRPGWRGPGVAEASVLRKQSATQSSSRRVTVGRLWERLVASQGPLTARSDTAGKAAWTRVVEVPGVKGPRQKWLLGHQPTSAQLAGQYPWRI